MIPNTNIRFIEKPPFKNDLSFLFILNQFHVVNKKFQTRKIDIEKGKPKKLPSPGACLREAPHCGTKAVEGAERRLKEL
jgi:hypothetical protein